ncbi:uncharacterized protein NP_3656A [Natronomonas pharaonis DSM 2160]|uniref:Uncharacterized protein n=1 Tax=Natronomonas pharaonis (strain ATCC 35678 / DSM 2160 / CIP 103997 / JCM 8858 / NBRC 14720 / NCIMB 2260 / Gabara) TaxID=348780 RepID=A0A1U7EXJ4_NATPD|nr:hypothetical protein [Natronomonas pharaonis]CAI49919.1 uncharacterized protein NP_3656A [Natronomonas pharaonis DSM 2160]
MTAASDRESAPIELRAHSTSPEKTVFTEPGNSDGWIATDYTVDVRR